MAKIYQFPQGEERAKFRREITRERKKHFAVKTGSAFVKWLGWGWFYLRLLAASVLHFIFVFVLAILGAFKWAVFMVRKLNRPFWGFLTMNSGDKAPHAVKSEAR